MVTARKRARARVARAMETATRVPGEGRRRTTKRAMATARSVVGDEESAGDRDCDCDIN
jgi:hypothetical protein